MSIVTPPEPAERVHARTTAVRLARKRLTRTRAVAPGPVAHRAVRSVKLRSLAVLSSLALAASVTGLVLFVHEPLLHAWRAVIVFWASALDLPVLWSRVPASGALGWMDQQDSEAGLSSAAWAATAAVVVLLYAVTYVMSDPMTPLKYLIRILCVVQGSALVFFALAPSGPTHSVGGHIEAVLSAGYTVMASVPVLIGMIYAVLRVPLRYQLVHPALVLCYFAIEIPHQAVLHVLIIDRLSPLFMPLLYLAFGGLFEVMIFIALYSWLVSKLPANVLG